MCVMPSPVLVSNSRDRIFRDLIQSCQLPGHTGSRDLPFRYTNHQSLEVHREPRSSEHSEIRGAWAGCSPVLKAKVKLGTGWRGVCVIETVMHKKGTFQQWENGTEVNRSPLVLYRGTCHLSCPRMRRKEAGMAGEATPNEEMPSRKLNGRAHLRK